MSLLAKTCQWQPAADQLKITPMANKLDFISRENILGAINRIDQEGVPKNNEWSEYWIVYGNGLYQFKYIVDSGNLAFASTIVLAISSCSSSRTLRTNLFSKSLTKPNKPVVIFSIE